MNNKIMKLNYEDTDKKIQVDIYGLIFEINKEEISKIKAEDYENSEDEKAIEKLINLIIGNDAVDKINEKRKQDGYNEMTIDVEVAVLSCLYTAYINAATNPMEDVANNINKTYERYNTNYNYRNNRKNYNRYGRR